TAGIPYSVTVTAQDQFNNTATAYGGTVHFTTSDTNGTVSLPTDSTLTSGVATFGVTLNTAGSVSVTATDTVSPPNVSGSSTVAVVAAAATHFAVSVPAGATAGNAFAITVTAQDPFNNTDRAYAGTVHFTSTDPNLQAGDLPANATLGSGVGNFTVTLRTVGAGTQSVIAT